MDCSLIAGELVPFHFGSLTGEARANVEGHITGCTRCLQAYLEVKRVIETGPLLSQRPSPSLRARLKADVAAQFAPRRTPHLRSVGALAAALVAAAGLIGLLATRQAGSPAQAPPGPALPATVSSSLTQAGGVDSARPVTAGPQFL